MKILIPSIQLKFPVHPSFHTSSTSSHLQHPLTQPQPPTTPPHATPFSHFSTESLRKMSERSSTPPKRRISNPTQPLQPAKASKMSASAPIFEPRLPTSSSTLKESGVDIESSRATKPLPNSRRPIAGADFVPVQASVPKSNEAKENTRRLIVVLSQVSGVSRLIRKLYLDSRSHISNADAISRGWQAWFRLFQSGENF